MTIYSPVESGTRGAYCESAAMISGQRKGSEVAESLIAFISLNGGSGEGRHLNWVEINLDMLNMLRCRPRNAFPFHPALFSRLIDALREL